MCLDRLPRGRSATRSVNREACANRYSARGWDDCPALRGTPVSVLCAGNIRSLCLTGPRPFRRRGIAGAGSPRTGKPGVGAALAAMPSHGCVRPALNLPGGAVRAREGRVHLCPRMPLGLSTGGVPLDAGGTHRTGAAGWGERVGDGADASAPGNPVAAPGPYPGVSASTPAVPTSPDLPLRTRTDHGRPGRVHTCQAARVGPRSAVRPSGGAPCPAGSARVSATTNLQDKGRDPLCHNKGEKRQRRE